MKNLMLSMTLALALGAPFAARAASPASQYDDVSYPDTERTPAVVQRPETVANPFDDAGLRGAAKAPSSEASLAQTVTVEAKPCSCHS